MESNTGVATADGAGGSANQVRVKEFLLKYSFAIVFVLLVVYLSFATSKFLTVSNIVNVFRQVSNQGIIAVGMTMILIMGQIDLSVGAIMVLCSVIMGQFTFRYGLPPGLSILCGLGAGAFFGYLNGVMVARLRLPPFIVTLGMWQILLAANFLYSRNETIRSQDIEAQAPILQLFAAKFTFAGADFTLGTLFMIALMLFLAFVLRHTAWGRHVYAVGDDPQAAELSGINVKATLISVYVIAGLICAMAGWVLIGRIGSVSPNSGQQANIESITAVVIGGISLFGGRGSILGTLFGALIVGVFTLGLRLLGADAQWTYLMIGALIIGAVAIDQRIRRVTA